MQKTCFLVKKDSNTHQIVKLPTYYATILMLFMLFHLLTESSALLNHSARGVQIIVHFMFRCSSNQCALVTQIMCTTSALAVT